MASAEQLKALLKSHLEGDEDRFFSVAMQVAAHEARLGHGKPRRGTARDDRRCQEPARRGFACADQPPARRVDESPGSFLSEGLGWEK